MKRIPILVTLILLVIVSGCAQKKDYVVTIKTRYGNMVAILYDETPLHKANFIKLAKEHYYDSTMFHRVIQGFMIQGGDPDSKKATPGQRLGQGGPGYTVNAEFNPKFFHERGALSAARLADAQNPTKASSGSQFYVVQGTKMTEGELRTDFEKLNNVLGQFFQNPANQGAYDSLAEAFQAQDVKLLQARMVALRPRVEKELNVNLSKEISPERLKVYTTVGGTPALDGGYTVFGKVIQGLDVLDKIAAVTTEQERPTEDIRMTVTVEELSVKKIEKLYGYHYPEKK
ncbi:peptidyl-prolyl cis-trans isomerase B (cyclophilin B) [Chryseolinea serpens]|uniref:Peptidyl-prolyl cis-trans isomerase n=1 Tax=Chryseolinea serpens TaxID=947013 RepID=A0A1M5RXE0_9BACT|nr:peptidylprolyl isomerase [Chryseolinea serpens]SHH30859.1 peptidyl-prolyl cis-trans isomerase B (cyclophilin B) [Chryseolinea serpens]